MQDSQTFCSERDLLACTLIDDLNIFLFIVSNALSNTSFLTGFMKCSTSSPRRYGGTELGVALVKKLIEMDNGLILVGVRSLKSKMYPSDHSVLSISTTFEKVKNSLFCLKDWF
jgi:hypothetical protein